MSPSETLSAGYESGQDLYLDARANVAAQSGRITEIEKQVHHLAEATVGSDSPIVSDAIALYRRDMAEVHGDSTVIVTNAGPGVAGFYDGTPGVYLDQNHIEESFWKHEKQHEKDGFASGVSLDEGVAEPVTETAPDVLGDQIDGDDEMVNLSLRAVLEKRATVAGGETPAAYQRDFVDPYDRTRARMIEAGVDADGAFEGLVHNDIDRYRDAVETTLAYENADAVADELVEEQSTGIEKLDVQIAEDVQQELEDDPEAAMQQLEETGMVGEMAAEKVQSELDIESQRQQQLKDAITAVQEEGGDKALDEVEAEAEQQETAESEAIISIIQETRYDYENGPESAREKKYKLAA